MDFVEIDMSPEDLKNINKIVNQRCWDAGYRLGRDEALEEAARAAETQWPLYENSVARLGGLDFGSRVAKEIRALKGSK